MKDRLVALIIDSVTQLNPDREWPPMDAAAILFGPTGLLDSIGLVNLIADLEERVLNEFGAGVVIADERAMSRFHSPFRTVGTLADFLADKLGATSNG